MRSQNNFRRTRKQRSIGVGGVAVLGIAVVLLIGVGLVFALKSTQETVTITIKDKERVTSSDSEGNSSSKYLIFAEGETFENTDSTLFWKFNSSDVYGQLDKGETYTCKVYGWRIQILSTYRNIVSCSK